MPEKEGQQQGFDVSAVHVGIGHDHDFAIAEFFKIKFVPDSGSQRLNDG